MYYTDVACMLIKLTYSECGEVFIAKVYVGAAKIGL